MKNLLYKEFHLSISPLTYFFVILAPILCLIPSYPIFVMGIYTFASYMMLFLGANKAVTTNDLFYTINLPLRRKEAVTARVLTITAIQLFVLLFGSACMMIRYLFIEPSIVSDGGEVVLVSIGGESLLITLACLLIGFVFYDLIFIPWFYTTGRNLTVPGLVGMLLYSVFMSILTSIPPALPGVMSFISIDNDAFHILIQSGILLVALLIYMASKFLIIKLSARNLEKVDF